MRALRRKPSKFWLRDHGAYGGYVYMVTEAWRTTPMIRTAADLAAAIRDLRPDAADLPITADWARDQMHAMDITRYEDVDGDALSALADAVDTLAQDTATD